MRSLKCQEQRTSRDDFIERIVFYELSTRLLFYIAQSVISDDRLRRSLSLAGPHEPKYINFVYSFVAHVPLSSCLRCEDQFVCLFPTRSTRTCRCHGKWSFFGSSIFLIVKNPYDLRSQIRFWVLPEKRTLTVGFIVWTANGCWPFPDLCQFQRPRCWESICPENRRSKIRLPCRLINSTSRKLLLLVHKIGHDAMELKSVNFDFFL